MPEGPARIMTGNTADITEEQLNLQSQMTELSRVLPWIERLGSQFSIPQSTQYGIDLCLEEALSNIVLHGYRSKPDCPITVRFASPREGYFVFVIEDEAPLFNTVDSPALPPINPLDSKHVGGQGIRLMRRFADKLEYQARPNGNRLTIGFSSARSSAATD
jgi:serine/threonine-protein kinase RsbW